MRLDTDTYAPIGEVSFALNVLDVLAVIGYAALLWHTTFGGRL